MMLWKKQTCLQKITIEGVQMMQHVSYLPIATQFEGSILVILGMQMMQKYAR